MADNIVDLSAYRTAKKAATQMKTVSSAVPKSVERGCPIIPLPTLPSSWTDGPMIVAGIVVLILFMLCALYWR